MMMMMINMVVWSARKAEGMMVLGRVASIICLLCALGERESRRTIEKEHRQYADTHRTADYVERASSWL